MTLGEKNPKSQTAFVPLDDRPCNASFPQKLGECAGFQLVLPPIKLLGRFKTPGDPDPIASWLKDIVPQVDRVIASVEMMTCGGLIASRSTSTKQNDAIKRIKIFGELKKLNPNVFIDLFSLIMKYSANASDEERFARKRNHEINKATLKSVSDGDIDLLIIGEDDVSITGPHLSEASELKALIKRSAIENKVNMLCGADEIGMMLIARAMLANRAIPKVYVVPLDEKGLDLIPMYEDRPLKRSIDEHISASGGVKVKNLNEADVILFVNTFKEKQRDLFLDGALLEQKDFGKFVQSIKKAVDSKKSVAIADVAYANGADPQFMEALLKEVKVEKLSAFAAWNTASNSLGSALAQAFAGKTKDKLFLLERFIDDYLYQSVLRQRIKKDLLERGASIYDLFDKYQPVNWVVKEELKDLAQDFAAKHFKSLDPKKLKFNIQLPWPRIFEVEIGISIY
jgi:hypothetical protein